MKKLSQKIAERKDIERQERVTRILTAARKVFFQKGFLSSTIRDIALEASLSPGLIYHYYEGKDALYGTICTEGFHALLSSLRKAELTKGTPVDRLMEVAKAYVKFYEEYPEYFDIISFRDLGFKKVDLPQVIRKELDNLSFQALDVIQRLIKEGVSEGSITPMDNLWDMTMMIWAPIEGLIFIHKRGYMETFGLDFNKIVDNEMAIILKGIKS